jgi:hypothetical protein
MGDIIVGNSYVYFNNDWETDPWNDTTVTVTGVLDATPDGLPKMYQVTSDTPPCIGLVFLRELGALVE